MQKSHALNETHAASDMRKGIRMMVYQEKIAPPLAPLTDEEQMKLRIESRDSEDRWVKNFIDRLAGVVRDMKH